MSTIQKKKVTFSSGRKFAVSLETYTAAQELVEDCKNRTNHDYEDMRRKHFNDDWYGVNSYDEALELMRVGYQPTVEKLSVSLKMSKSGVQKRIKFENSVHGFAPVVPLALKGVPNSMIDMSMKQIKCKVVDVYYDICVHCGTSTNTIIECGQKLLAAIIEMEKQGYRFNLYAIQGYSSDSSADVLCVKVKSSDKPLDLKRISFPLTHPAFFRVIGFDWQGKSPVAKYRGSGRGSTLNSNISTNESKEFAKQVFGENAIYLSCYKIQYEDIEYIKEVLVG